MASPLKRKIGNSDVFCIGYGAMGIGGVYDKDFKPQPDEERFKVRIFFIDKYPRSSMLICWT